MKGKGKGAQDKECPLMFPDLEPVDHVKQCPRYTAILSRGEGETVGLEELDVIQADLETLLANAGKRLKVLENEMQLLTNWQEKSGEIKPVGKVKGGKVQPETPSKRSKAAEDKPSKKFKETSGKASTVLSGGKLKTKLSQVKPPDHVDHLEPNPIEIPKLPKNNAVNKFWTSVEPYCADISNDDIKFLEELIRSHEDDSEYFKVPSLGMHYTEKWAEEDLIEEQKQGSKISDKRNGVADTNGATTLLKTAEAGLHDESPFGPLTQRLVSALIEENIMTPIDDEMDDVYPEDESLNESAAISPKELAKQLNLGNPSHLEKRIKRELEEQGILDFEEDDEDDENDEILRELRAKQAELKVICQHNIMSTKRLYKLAKEEMAKQELKRKLAVSDSEVMDAYRKVQLTKQKKKTPTKKERDAVIKALKDRELLMKQIDINV
ncbi:transcriptional adapter 3-B-like isoform X2 [Mercenaria mercenaria]|uniref:transcriptional adapter 3-B-like isoform X2 n=1 Tax=Mercenaria mercenaria TaxID=6596 RepID=UPI00234FA2B9|nr:transcriptional adapter 3-B-like isoform X2 [Mercenaria mercenaria]